MAVPNIFGSATSAIPLSQLDTNFATPVTIGNTAVQLGNTVTSFGNVTLTNVTISSGNVTITGANVSGTANVSTLIVTSNQTSLGNVAITGNISANIATFSAGSNTAPSITTTGDTNTGIFFPAADTIAFTEGGAEAMRIDSSGNVGIGTNSPGVKLDVNGALRVGLASNPTSISGNSQFYDQAFIGPTISGLNFTVRTGSSTPTETMRIDSSGNVGIKTTSPTSNLQVFSQFIDASTPTTQSLRLYFNSTYFSEYTENTIQCFNNIFKVISGTTGGVQLTNGATSWASVSDARLKNVTGTYTNALSDIAQIEAVKFTWKSDEDNKPQVGVIAQSVLSVVPEAVVSENDSQSGVPVDTQYYSVRYTELIPLMIASIQELKAQNESLKARLDAASL